MMRNPSAVSMGELTDATLPSVKDPAFLRPVLAFGCLPLEHLKESLLILKHTICWYSPATFGVVAALSASSPIAASMQCYSGSAYSSVTDVCRVQGFPTIKAFVNGRMIDYNGDRSAGHLKDWAISLIPQKVRHKLPAGK